VAEATRFGQRIEQTTAASFRCAACGEMAGVVKVTRYYSSGSLHGLTMSRPLTLPYHMQQHFSHDMRAALTSRNA
jgi:hypothetical protein